MMELYGDASTSNEWEETFDETQQDLDESAEEGGVTSSQYDEIYKTPNRVDSGEAGDSIDDVIEDADSFVNQGSSNLDEADLQEFSSIIYNIFLTIGIVVAVIVGGVIGIKLMASNIETKVEAKKLLVPYIVGCIVVFGAFAIWKMVITFVQGV